MGRRSLRKIHRGLDGDTARDSQRKDTSRLTHLCGIKAKVTKNTVGWYNNRFRLVYRKIPLEMKKKFTFSIRQPILT